MPLETQRELRLPLPEVLERVLEEDHFCQRTQVSRPQRPEEECPPGRGLTWPPGWELVMPGLHPGGSQAPPLPCSSSSRTRGA